MSQLNNLFLPLIKTFDCIGWIPSIRGSLSISMFDNFKYLWGDVDKFSVEVKKNNGFNTSRYLAASSIFTFDDSKRGKWTRKDGWEYCRTFRFIFRGTINDAERQTKFITQNFNDEDRLKANELFKKKELLVGKLSIVANISNKFAEPIKVFLENLSSLSEIKQKSDYNKRVLSYEELDEKENAFHHKWSTIEENIITIENDIKTNNPIYTFDVILSRDGILFLRDVTDEIFRSSYFMEGKASDFTQNTRLPRLFMIAMNFVKCLFHKNYHHSEENDTFLPVTNLHSIDINVNFDKITKHQIEAFLSPIVKAKQNIKKYTLINPKGILFYAEAFLHVFENNRFISGEDASLLYKFIDIQRKEFEDLQSENKIILNSFLSQKNILTRITVGFSFLITTTVIFNFSFGNNTALNQDTIKIIDQLKPLITFSSFMIGILFHSIVIKVATIKGRFIKKEKRRNIFKTNSDIKKGEFSLCYAILLFWIELKMIIKKLNIYKFKLTMLLLSIPGISFLWYYFIYKLLLK